MTADEKWGVFLMGCGVVILAVEGLIRLARWIDRTATREVDRHVALALAVTDDDWLPETHAAHDQALALDHFDWSERALDRWAKWENERDFAEWDRQVGS